jgi:hypothetical protein
MKLSRLQFLHLVAGAAALPAVSRTAKAQAYPSRPITMIVPLPAGSALDTIGRLLAERIRSSTESMGLFLENARTAPNRKVPPFADDVPDEHQYRIEAKTNGRTQTIGIINGLSGLHPRQRCLDPAGHKASLGTYGAAGRLLSAFFQKKRHWDENYPRALSWRPHPRPDGQSD